MTPAVGHSKGCQKISPTDCHVAYGYEFERKRPYEKVERYLMMVRMQLTQRICRGRKNSRFFRSGGNNTRVDVAESDTSFLL